MGARRGDLTEHEGDEREGRCALEDPPPARPSEERHRERDREALEAGQRRHPARAMTEREQHLDLADRRCADDDQRERREEATHARAGYGDAKLTSRPSSA
jgi:hypothetical protein